MTEQNVIDKDMIRAEIKDWIQHILDRKHWAPTNLARAAKLAPSTVLRMFNDEHHTFIPTYSTLAKIAAASGYKPTEKIMKAFGVSMTDGFGAEDVGNVHRLRAQSEATRNGVSDDRDSDTIPKPRFHSLGKVRHPVPVEREPVEMKNLRVGPPPGSRRRDMSQLRLEHVSNLPRSIRPMTSERFVDAPASLDGDVGAFAFHLHDETLSPLLTVGSTIFATRSKDPIEGDLVLVTREGGQSLIRVVDRINEDGITLVHPITRQTITLDFESIEDTAVIKSMERR